MATIILLIATTGLGCFIGADSFDEPIIGSIIGVVIGLCLRFAAGATLDEIGDSVGDSIDFD